LLAGWAKYHPQTEAGGFIARLSVSSIPIFSEHSAMKIILIFQYERGKRDNSV